MAASKSGVRCLRLLSDLMDSDEGLTVKQMMRLSVRCRRTVYNDLDTLKEAGFALESTELSIWQTKVRWRLKD